MKIAEKHSLPLRIVHWINLPLIALMVWSGILIYWANDIYPGFFPEWFYSTFKVDHRLAEGMAIHFFIAWFFIFNGLIYLCWFFGSGHWREIFPNRTTLRDALPVILHDMGLRKEAPKQGKFNAMQRIAYTGLILIAALAVLSGFAIYKPVQLSWLTALFGGYEGARLVHFAMMISICLFAGVHVVQVLRAGWNNFRAMVAGFEVEND
jgi:thiosulfate reductase cytochrome b subunit